MTLRRLFVFGGATAALVLTGVGAAAGQDPAEPVITGLSSANPSVGQTIGIRGRQFRRGIRRNTLVFRSPSGRSVFVKADTATTTRLTVTLPPTLEPLLARNADGSLKPTKFRLRVLAGRFGGLSLPRLSPVVGPTQP